MKTEVVQTEAGAIQLGHAQLIDAIKDALTLETEYEVFESLCMNGYTQERAQELINEALGISNVEA